MNLSTDKRPSRCRPTISIAPLQSSVSTLVTKKPCKSPIVSTTMCRFTPLVFFLTSLLSRLKAAEYSLPESISRYSSRLATVSYFTYTSPDCLHVLILPLTFVSCTYAISACHLAFTLKFFMSP